MSADVKTETTPVSPGSASSEKAVSPLRSASAVQDAPWLARVQIVAALFCLLVSGAMLYQHYHATERDPWKSPQLLALKEKLRATPTDESLRSEIRQLDLEFRQRYFRRLALNQTGGWLLVGGLAAMLIAARRAVKLVAQPYLPKRRTETTPQAIQRTAQARWGVAGVGVVTLAGLGMLVFTASSSLPNSATELDKLLGRDTAEAEASAPTTLADFQANWPRFRGWDGSGTAAFTNIGTEVIWKSPVLAPGFNSPVVWSNHLFISGGDANQREVFCYDTADGKLLWQRAVANVPGSPASPPDIPEMTGFTAATMATDGHLAFAMFANGDLAAFKFDGTLAWAKNLGVPKNMYGHAASIAIWPGKLVVQRDQDEDAPGGSKLLAFDCATGRLLWEHSKPTHGSWASPTIIEAAGKTQIITLALPFVMSHALADGTELWRAELMDGEITPSPIFTGGLVIAVSPSGNLIALRPDGAGDVTKSHVAWTTNENIPDITSPNGNNELIFTATTMGGVACFDRTNGTLLWQKELEFEVQSSPALVGNQLLVLGTKGDVVSLAAAREFRELSRAKLEDAFHASPALVGGRIYLRGATNLWCLGEK
jgi:outer membrane protein assembly factor BamB